MSGSAIARITQRASEADQLIRYLHNQLGKLRSLAAAKACQAEEQRLAAENEKLKRDVARLKNQLRDAEEENGIKQIPLPATSAISTAAPAPAQPAPAKAAPAKEQNQPKQEKNKEKKPEKKNKGGGGGGAADNLPIDISRLDLRVGLITEAKKHPDADGLYVEEVDLGEEKPRTIVSGLVKFVPLESMQQRLAIFACNLKPAKMRGIMSAGMIMCGSSPEIVEIIEVPEGAAIGDRVSVEGYPGTPDAQLNPKKKIWEQIQPDLRISAEGIATYKGTPWNVAGKGTCKVPTMRDTIIK